MSVVLSAADCAEHVSPYFDEKYPKDNQSRKAVEAVCVRVCDEVGMSEAYTAAFATRAAGHAATTSHVTILSQPDRDPRRRDQRLRDRAHAPSS